MNLTVQQAAKATAGRVIHPKRFPERLRIVTDTRTLRAGDVFLALRGERFDGHAYVTEALARGAAGLIIDEPGRELADAPALLVAKTAPYSIRLTMTNAA